MSKRAPFIALYTDVLKDESLHVLADIGGYNRYEALGRVSVLWLWCRDRGLQDAPADSAYYAVSEAVIRRHLGPSGVDAILGGGCDDLALGIRFRDGLIQLRGTQHDVARLRDLGRTRQAGGRARAGGARDSMGRFGTPPGDELVSETTVVQHDSACGPSSRPAADQQNPPDHQRPDPDPDPKKKTPPPSRQSRSAPLPPDSLRLGLLLLTRIAERSPQTTIARETPEQRERAAVRHAEHIEKLHRLGRVDWSDIEAVIEWCTADPFWSANVQSGQKLREKFNTLVSQRARGAGRQQQTASTGRVEPKAPEEYQHGRIEL